jgi:predicted TIM-barrel fold metal-dependent hydrolase
VIVDVHAHHHPRAYNEAIAPLYPGANLDGLARFPDTDDEAHVAARLELMDEAGVSMQVLSPAAGRAPYGADERAAVHAAQLGNDANAELVGRYPDKFRSFVSLPLPHIDASVRELRRGMDELGMIGVNLHISVLDRSVAEDEFLPIYDEVNQRGGVIFYHPCNNGVCSPMITDYGLNGALGTSFEDAAIVLHLIAKRIPAQFENIRFVIPHLGGPIPMLLERLDNQFSMKHRRLAEPPSVTARRFYYDTVAHGSHAALLCAWKAFGADHLLPGSDYPVLLAHETYARTFSWIREVDLPAADIDQILERTAPTVLDLDPVRQQD